MKAIMSRIGSVCLAVVALLVLAVQGAWCETLNTISDTAVTALTDNIYVVAPKVFTVISVMLGIGFLIRWLKRAARSS